jgi:endonuclease/exonuclease/phosphatase family metal-dependent hydrolase
VVNGRTINLFSTHVDYYNGSYRTTQTNQLHNWASSWAENRIIMGDFNARPGTSDYGIMTSSYYDSWAAPLCQRKSRAYRNCSAASPNRSR